MCLSIRHIVYCWCNMFHLCLKVNLRLCSLLASVCCVDITIRDMNAILVQASITVFVGEQVNVER